MLNFGYIEDFKDADTLLIWGDAVGLADLEKLFRGLAAQANRRVLLNEMKWAASRDGLKVAFEVNRDGAGALEITKAAELTILVACSPEQFVDFADKVAALVGPDCANGHHYLDVPGMGDRQIIVSKGEYPPDFGSA